MQRWEEALGLEILGESDEIHVATSCMSKAVQLDSIFQSLAVNFAPTQPLHRQATKPPRHAAQLPLTFTIPPGPSRIEFDVSPPRDSPPHLSHPTTRIQRPKSASTQH